MKIFKIVVYSALIIFHLTTIIVISIGRGNFDFLLKLFNKLDLMLYGSYLGLILFATTILFDYLQKRNIQSLDKKHQEEINGLKARLYDKKESEPQVAPAAIPAKEEIDTATDNPGAETRVD